MFKELSEEVEEKYGSEYKDIILTAEDHQVGCECRNCRIYWYLKIKIECPFSLQELLNTKL